MDVMKTIGFPPRIEDIPKEVLCVYGLYFQDEDNFVNDHEEEEENEPDPGPLVIDESHQKDLDETKEDKALVSGIIIKKENDDKAPTGIFIQNEKTDKSLATGSMIKKEKDDGGVFIPKAIELQASDVFFCYLCKKLISDVSQIAHKEKHCFFVGCPELIESAAEKARHAKMHDHPSKPLQCRVCKKRYRYYSYVERHLKKGMCKMSAYKIAKENWRRATAQT